MCGRVVGVHFNGRTLNACPVADGTTPVDDSIQNHTILLKGKANKPEQGVHVST